MERISNKKVLRGYIWRKWVVEEGNEEHNVEVVLRSKVFVDSESNFSERVGVNLTGKMVCGL